jgi:hypothetical protein
MQLRKAGTVGIGDGDQGGERDGHTPPEPRSSCTDSVGSVAIGADTVKGCQPVVWPLFSWSCVVVPYQYTIILWAVVLGFLVFRDVPDAFTLCGAARRRARYSTFRATAA